MIDTSMIKVRVRTKVHAYPMMEGKVSGIIESLRALIAQYGDTVRIENEPVPFCPNDSYENNVYVERDETDEEYRMRIHNDQLAYEDQKRRDLANLKRLKEKYGDV